MLEQLKYVNHQNEVFEFGKNGVYVNQNDLRDFAWTATKRNNRISALNRDVSNRNLTIIIICATEAEGTAVKNRLHEISEKDVYAMKYGKIVIGDYYFKCFVTKSQKAQYLINKRYMRVTLTLTTDQPYWIKETTKAFRTAASSSGTVSGLDYPHDFPFDYLSATSNDKINNTGFVASAFKLIVYGECTNPLIYIGDHAYQVNCTVDENEYLTIDSVAKQIYLTKNDGTIINEFNQRKKDSYIFEKIPAGMNAVSWNGSFGFDLTLLEERSEPKWT